MKKKSTRNNPMSEMNVVPYIDVMLVLMVIFMITAPMLTQGVTVDLPKMASDSIQSAEREPLIVSVDKDGLYYLNISNAPSMPMETSALTVRIAAELALAKEEHQVIQVLVKGDSGVPYGKVMEAMNVLKQAGADKVGLVTDSLIDDKQEAHV